MDKKLRFDSIIFGGNGQDGYLMSRFLLKQKKKIVIIIRKKNDIDSAIEALEKGGEFDGAVTLGKFKTHPDLAKTVEGNYVIESSLNVNQSRRQDLKELYFPFGVAYVVRTSVFRKELTFYPKKLTHHIIEDWQCYEIDDYWDWVCVEAIMEKTNEFS